MQSIGVALRGDDPSEKQSVSKGIHSVFGWDSWTRTNEMQESKSCALTDLAISQYNIDYFGYYITAKRVLSIQK